MNFIKDLAWGFGVMFGVIALLALIGCGSVEMARMDGGGADTGGTTGSDGGVDTQPHPCDATCDLGCNTCVNNVCTPIADGTSCNGPVCDGPTVLSGLGGSYPTVASNFACQVGACVKTVVDCATMACTTCTNGTPTGCFLYDESGNDTGKAECRCVNTKTGQFCPRS